MHSPDEGVETVAELIARLVWEYEARQIAKAKKANKPTASRKSKVKSQKSKVIPHR